MWCPHNQALLHLETRSGNATFRQIRRIPAEPLLSLCNLSNALFAFLLSAARPRRFLYVHRRPFAGRLCRFFRFPPPLIRQEIAPAHSTGIARDAALAPLTLFSARNPSAESAPRIPPP